MAGKGRGEGERKREKGQGKGGAGELAPQTEQVHSCRSKDAFAQKRCEIKAEGRGDGSKKNGRKIVKN
jgi:hypothetical protein